MSHDNVVEFAEYRSSAADASPAAGAAQPLANTAAEGPNASADASRRTRGAVHAISQGAFALAKFVGLMLRMSLFFILRWVRGPITLILGVLSAFGLFGALIIWFGFTGEGDPTQRNQLLTMSLLIGFGSSILRFGYDYLLAALAPAHPQP